MTELSFWVNFPFKNHSFGSSDRFQCIICCRTFYEKVCMKKVMVFTHSRVSSVMMMRMGLRFIPPTQLLLHMKLYRMVVNSVPTLTNRWRERERHNQFPEALYYIVNRGYSILFRGKYLHWEVKFTLINEFRLIQKHRFLGREKW